jgi:eukaryotic-like serine/threonine-protein kinase
MSRLTEERAQRLFAEHVARRPRRAADALEALCREHPDLASSLRRLEQERSEARVEAPRVPGGAGAKLLGTARSRTRYVLLGEVARGGMGLVLRVWDTLLERPVAMKVLDTKALPTDLERFLTEARVAGRLQHRGIVPFCEGRTLEEVFELTRTRADGWSLGRALRVLLEACDVVAHAHSRGVLHRDLKPANLIVGPSGEVWVIDWGLAKAIDAHEPAPEPEKNATERVADPPPGQTLAGTVAGTPPYMAPEQADGRVADVSFRTDVYALGAMLYRLVAGRSPYAPREGTDEPAKTLELIRRGPPTPLGTVAPEAPAQLVAIVDRAMAREPKGRYPSVEALARDLRAFVETLAEDDRP